MRNISRRIDRIEKKLRIEEPYLVNIGGLEIPSDKLDELIKEIWAESKGLPIRERTAT